MLETSTLVIDPWAPSAPLGAAPAWMRSIVDDGGRSLGFVRFVGNPSAFWFKWLRRVRLEVYETDDASHLMSVTRAWGFLRHWQIHDADEHHVGGVYLQTIVTSENQAIAYLDLGESRMLDPSGRVLARFEPAGNRLKLTFAANLPLNPFERMVLLGTVLSLDAAPPG